MKTLIYKNRQFRYNPIKFREFLLEMETSPQEKQYIREIIHHLIQNDAQWLKAKNIQVGNKPPYWILNYGPGSKKDERNEYNKLVRGMVVQQPQQGQPVDDLLSLIKSFPFTRFFNKAEEDADKINFLNSEMLEKMDGTMVGVFFPNGDPNNPQWHTRKMVSSHQDDMNMVVTSFRNKEYKLIKVIGNFVKNLIFTEEDVPHTYILELIHDATSVVTQYQPEQSGLYLLGGRDVQTHKELTEKELDNTAARINAKRPQRWDAVASHDDIEVMLNQIAKEIEDFEGFVFRDKENGKRVKLKHSDYVMKHR